MHWILVLYLLNPSTNVESTKFVIVDSEQRCTTMKMYITSPEYRERSERHTPHHQYVIQDVKCEPIDLSKYERK